MQRQIEMGLDWIGSVVVLLGGVWFQAKHALPCFLEDFIHVAPLQKLLIATTGSPDHMDHHS